MQEVGTVKMVLKQKQCYSDKVRGATHSTTMSGNEYLLDENGADADCMSYMSSHTKKKNVESKMKQRVKDEESDYNFCCEEESEPQYELFLGRLKEHGKSYMLESLEFEENGIEYEGGGLSSDTECDQELRKKPSRQMIHVKNERNGRKVKLVHSKKICVVRKDDSQSTQKKEMKKLTMTRSEDEGDAFQIDPDYQIFFQNLKVSNIHSYPYIASGRELMYESACKDGLQSTQTKKMGKTIEYEGGLSSYTACDQELRKKPSRRMIHVKNESSFDSQLPPSTDIEILNWRKTRSQSRREMEGNTKLSTKINLPRSTYPRSTPALKWHSSLDKHCDPEPERMLSGRKVKLVHSEKIHVVRKDDSQSTQKEEMKKLTMTRNEDEGNAFQIDPDYQMFFQNLKVSNIQSYPYIASGRELVYESACKNALQSTQTKEMGNSTTRNLKNKPARSEEEDHIVLLDPDYRMLCQNLRVLDNHNYAYKDSTHYVVYELNGGDSIPVKEEYNDGCHGSDSDVEMLDSTTFYKMNKSSMSESTGVSEFRQKVIAALRKPFDEEELENLWNHIEVRKRAERHLDLRHGRERSYGKQKVGKSYLDCYPVLKKKLSQMKDDKPKRLNLLRGFFVWLTQPDSFTPWTDNECLAIYPESGKD